MTWLSTTFSTAVFDSETGAGSSFGAGSPGGFSDFKSVLDSVTVGTLGADNAGAEGSFAGCFLAIRPFRSCDRKYANLS